MEQRAHQVGHEQQRDQYGDQRDRQRHQGEANLAGTFQRRLAWAFTVFQVAGDVLQHDDRIVHHEAGGNGQRHQREVVERIAGQQHHRERTDQRQRHRHAGNQRGRQVAQEHPGHQNHQRDGQHQFLLYAAHGRTDRFGAVAEHGHLHAGRQRGLQLWQQRTYLLDHGDDVGAGLALDVHQHRRGGAAPCRQLAVLGTIGDGRHIAQPQWCALAPGQHQCAVLGHAAHLVVGIEHHRADRAIEAALGQVDVGRGDRGADVVHAQVVGGQCARIDLDAHGGALATGQTNQTNTRQLRQPLRDAGVDQVMHLRQRQALRGHRQGQDRRVGRIDLAVHRRHRQITGQEAAGRVDRRLHVLFGHTQRHLQAELQGDYRGAAGTGGRQLFQAGNLPELALQRRSDGARGQLRAGTGVERGDLDDRVVDLRQRRHRQQAIGQYPGQQQRHHQQGGGDRAQDEGAREVHAPALVDASSVMISTAVPSSSPSMPSITTLSPATRPERTATRPSSAGPRTTVRRCALLFLSMMCT
ncbi:hypothetical protein D3C72_854320 [compost metagenome]